MLWFTVVSSRPRPSRSYVLLHPKLLSENVEVNEPDYYINKIPTIYENCC